MPCRDGSARGNALDDLARGLPPCLWTPNWAAARRIHRGDPRQTQLRAVWGDGDASLLFDSDEAIHKAHQGNGSWYVNLYKERRVYDGGDERTDRWKAPEGLYARAPNRDLARLVRQGVIVLPQRRKRSGDARSAAERGADAPGGVVAAPDPSRPRTFTSAVEAQRFASVELQKRSAAKGGEAAPRDHPSA